jgi:hypothetical protein
VVQDYKLIPKKLEYEMEDELSLVFQKWGSSMAELAE